MSETRGNGSVVRYYCTAGNGMELFLVDEVKGKLAAEDVRQIPGKVLFSSSATIDRVSGLKAAERLFLLLKEDSPFRLPSHSSPGKASSLLQTRLLGDRNQWSSAVMTWSRLQRELAASRKADKTQRNAMGERMEKEEGRGSEEGGKCILESRKRTRELSEEESEHKRLRSDEQNRPETLKKEREEDNVRETKNEGLQGFTVVNNVADLDIESSRGKEAEQNEANFQVSRSDNVQAGLERTVENCNGKMNHLGVDVLSENVENVSFRVNCKCSGSLSRCLSAQEVSKVMGAGLSRLLGWKADLKNPQMEINVYLSDDYCLLGIPLTRIPLANRSYIKTTGLRSTTAWAMASLAQIQPGFSVVDPMCGMGTILIEAAQEHKAACFLGVDIDDGQLQKANENIAFAELGSRVHLLKASSMALPLPSSSVDAVICDLPFGRKFGTKTNMATDLPLILSEMERVLRIGGVLVVLLSPQLSSVLKKLLIQKHTEPISNEEIKPPTGIENCLVPSSEQQILQRHLDVKSSPTQEGEERLSSLQHQTTLRVSLGAIDGLIHKYVKTLI
ncbi:THUMP domain-containing protein 2 isoform X2 [Kryptolebias marmoratus]|uniref:THUMP domain-containing protein 2 isoform X2 n=1 Tax=Kryptolebias marmoratus TaxID=37003 RepID=UPI0007F93BC7|nr:THUMP domain-containing protein 2 isoform X2 [Kryptolebias marmoratus]